MKYNHKIVEGIFVKRKNRFVAQCEIDHQLKEVHVPNTGRCRELLKKGVTVYMTYHDNPHRKTNYTLTSVEKGNLLVNIDSSAPNKIVEEALKKGKIPLDFTPKVIRREYTYGKSRLDFYLEGEGKKALMEVKGVTLEQDGIVAFPDAPTLRGLKHIRELEEGLEDGYQSYIVFVIQMNRGKFFVPNHKMQKDFGQELKRAEEKGVKILCYTCLVSPDGIQLKNQIPYYLEDEYEFTTG
ncbi:MAG: DNA/RNA nuclease SfsA [Tissierellia bacterium]|nr:DNA/RNA nuclease SfsA [Tissierellia bacterium]